MQKLSITGHPPATGDIKERVKTFEDACKVLGIQQSELTVSGELENDFKSLSAYAKLIIITRALNEGWVPNWKDGDEYKYYPWFDLSSGSGLRYVDVYVSRTSYSYVGSRLCFLSSDLAEYAGKQFKKLYEEYFLL
jgi:hypothetical protein